MSIISLKNTPYFIFLFLLIFAPLAFGLDELWSLTVMEALCFTAALFYFCYRENREAVYRVPGIVPLMLLVSFSLLQIIPLPAGLVGVISPATLALYKETIGIVEMPAWLTLSINPRSTLEEFFRFSAYVTFYVLSIQILTDSRRLKNTVFTVLSLCSLIALQAILQKYLDNGRIYWLRPAPFQSSFTGPYLYHNHFAGYVEMLVPVAIALFFRYRPQIHYGNSWRQRIAHALAYLQFNTHLLLGFAAVLMAVSIFLSMSRGGMISFGVSCFILLIVLSRRAKKNASIQHGLVLFTVIFLAVGWFGWDVIDQRFGVMFDQRGNLREARPLIWFDSIGIIKDFPLTGTGWGTFGNIFPTYMTFLDKNFMYHAHNDYIETLTNGGIVSLVLIVWFLGSVFRQILKALFRRRDSFAVYLTWGSLAGILAFIIHSVVDFNFQNGANGLYFFFLLALAISASHTRSHGNMATMLMPKKTSVLRFVVIFCSGLLLVISIVVNSTSIKTSRQLAALTPFSWNGVTPKKELQDLMNRLGRILPTSSLNSYTWASRQLAALMPLGWSEETSEKELRDIKARLGNILSISPLNSYTHFLMADVQKCIGNDEEAARYYKKAIRLNPAQASYLQNFGLFLAAHGERKMADSLMQAGILHGLSNPDYKRNYARFLINGNEKEKVLQIMTTVFAQHPDKAARDVAFLVDAGISDNDIRRILPDRVIPFLTFAAHLEQKGDLDQAAALYHQSLTYVYNEEKVWPSYFYRVSKFFRKQKRYEEGLNVILEGTKLFPADVGLRIRAGNLYENMGLVHRAVEQYQLALSIERANPQARKHLEKLQHGVDKKIKL